MNQAPKAQAMIAGVALLIGIALGFLIQTPQARQAEAPPIRPIQQTNQAIGLRWKSDQGTQGEMSERMVVLSNSLPKDVDITAEDWAEAVELSRHMGRGEYVLKWEGALAEKTLKSFFKKAVSLAETNNSAEYNRVFGSLGIQPAKTEQLKLHLSQIYRASLEAEGALQQLLLAQWDFDRRLHDTLDEEQYLAYREFEDMKPALLEYDHFRKFLESKGVAAPAQDSELGRRILSIMKQSRAYSDISWQGPYGGVPQIAIGPLQCSVQWGEKIQEIKERAESADACAAKAGIPDEYRQLLKEHYAARIEWKRKELETVLTKMAEKSPAGRLAQKTAP